MPLPIKQERDRRREHSREREREREHDRFEPRRIKKEPRSRSRSPNPPSDRNRAGPPPDRRDRPRLDERDRSRERARERDRAGPPDRPRPDERDRSREKVRERDRGGPPPDRRDRDRPRHNERNRSREGARERDWDNFFNPNSEMSKQAFVKREKEEKERKTAVGEFGKEEEAETAKEKEQPNFGLSGKLTEETNTFRGVVIKYSEPPEARKPNKIRWRLYPFKGEEALPVMYVHRQSAYLLGRDRKVADIPVDHPSCSKQHAVLQYRLVPYVRADGSKGRRIRPYIIDLESANGTFVNGNQIDPKRYVELFEKDVLKFGFSSREYVLLHEESKNVEDDYQELTPD